MARPKGTPNKTTAELRGLLTEALQGEIAAIPERLASISDPEKRLTTLARFLPYILPKAEPDPETFADILTRTFGCTNGGGG